MSLVLSLFPGADLLGLAFELEGFTVVAGPDIQFGRDVRTFHVPAGRFDGVIGGPPCQAFSTLQRINKAMGRTPPANLIPEFERLVLESQPAWFLMENVKDAPLPVVAGYEVRSQLVRDVWVGGLTTRMRRFSFGTRDGAPLHVQWVALHTTSPEHAVTTSSGGRRANQKFGPDGMPVGNQRWSGGELEKLTVPELLRRQGLPPDFLADGPFTVEGKRTLIGNGVPLPMGRAVARAVRDAMADEVAA